MPGPGLNSLDHLEGGLTDFRPGLSFEKRKKKYKMAEPSIYAASDGMTDKKENVFGDLRRIFKTMSRFFDGPIDLSSIW